MSGGDVSRLKRWARLWMPPILHRALRPRVVPAPSVFRGLNGLDIALAQHLNLSQPGFFVELGANDGLRQSNTFFLEEQHGWRGLLIEPALNNYLELIRNRSPENRFACAACVSHDYSGEFVRMRYANLMSVSSSLDVDLPDTDQHVTDGSRFLRDVREVVDFGAIARPLSDILMEVDAPSQMQLLSLDVEGAELEVLRGVDHQRHRFTHIVVECRDIDHLDEYLVRFGYRLVNQLSVHDYLYTDVSEALDGAD